MSFRRIRERAVHPGPFDAHSEDDGKSSAGGIAPSVGVQGTRREGLLRISGLGENKINANGKYFRRGLGLVILYL